MMAADPARSYVAQCEIVRSIPQTLYPFPKAHWMRIRLRQPQVLSI